MMYIIKEVHENVFRICVRVLRRTFTLKLFVILKICFCQYIKKMNHQRISRYTKRIRIFWNVACIGQIFDYLQDRYSNEICHNWNWWYFFSAEMHYFCISDTEWNLYFRFVLFSMWKSNCESCRSVHWPGIRRLNQNRHVIVTTEANICIHWTIQITYFDPLNDLMDYFPRQMERVTLSETF